MRARHCLLPLVLLWLAVELPLRAAQLPSAGWAVRGPLEEAVTGLADNNLETVAVIRGTALAPFEVVVDLQVPHLIHRVFLTGGARDFAAPELDSVDALLELEDGATAEAASYPETLSVFVGDTADAGSPAAAAEIPEGPGEKIRFDADLRFQPLRGRYVRLRLAEQGEGLLWGVAELELYGTADPQAFKPVDAVVLEPDAPRPLRIAAEELRYYVGELTGRPLPIVDPDRTNDYPGTLYRIVDLKPLAETWDQMQANREAGKLPEGVNVERLGREVQFRAWPYEHVLNSVWEFLRRQGVRWVYPDAQGDWVPAGRGVNLDLLPLRYRPPARWRYANFGTEHTTGEAFLFWWRNGYNATWGHHQRRVLGGAEIPPNPYAPLRGEDCAEEYRDGFMLYPHTFNNVIPSRVLEAHPEWCGMVTREWSLGYNEHLTREDRGTRIPPSRMPWRGRPTFCMTNPEAIRFVIDKIIHVSAHPASSELFWLLPMDACYFCECPRCKQFYGPLPAEGRFNASEAYYHFIAEVARGVGEARPKVQIGALAYSSCYLPPEKIEKLPDNVFVQVCVYGARYLPMDSPANAETCAVWHTWRRKAAHLGYYDYLLIHPGAKKGEATLPIPAAAAIADRTHFLHGLGALEGGPEGDMVSLPYNPWNGYAYPRLIWDPSLTAEAVCREFFEGYFREAQEPMRAYYRVLEDHLIKYAVDPRGALPGVYPIPVVKAMGEHLQGAEKACSGWVTSARVAKIRESYDRLLEETGLTGVDLNDLSRFPRVGAESGPIEQDLPSLPIHKLYVSWRETDKEWCFGAHGSLGTHVIYEQPCRCEVTIEAKARPYEDIWPIVTVYAGPAASEPVTIDSTDYKTYTFNLDVPVGTWQTILDYRNAATGGRRNVFIRAIQLRTGK